MGQWHIVPCIYLYLHKIVSWQSARVGLLTKLHNLSAGVITVFSRADMFTVIKIFINNVKFIFYKTFKIEEIYILMTHEYNNKYILLMLYFIIYHEYKITVMQVNILL